MPHICGPRHPRGNQNNPYVRLQPALDCARRREHAVLTGCRQRPRTVPWMALTLVMSFTRCWFLYWGGASYSLSNLRRQQGASYFQEPKYGGAWVAPGALESVSRRAHTRRRGCGLLPSNYSCRRRYIRPHTTRPLT